MGDDRDQVHLAPVLEPGAAKRLPIERDRVVEPACRVLVLVLSGLVLLARVLWTIAWRSTSTASASRRRPAEIWDMIQAFTTSSSASASIAFSVRRIVGSSGATRSPVLGEIRESRRRSASSDSSAASSPIANRLVAPRRVASVAMERIWGRS
jgi:hypothetical protein